MHLHQLPPSRLASRVHSWCQASGSPRAMVGTLSLPCVAGTSVRGPLPARLGSTRRVSGPFPPSPSPSAAPSASFCRLHSAAVCNQRGLQHLSLPALEGILQTQQEPPPGPRPAPASWGSGRARLRSPVALGLPGSASPEPPVWVSSVVDDRSSVARSCYMWPPQSGTRNLGTCPCETLPSPERTDHVSFENFCKKYASRVCLWAVVHAYACFQVRGNIQNYKTWGQDAKMCESSYPGQSRRLNLEGAASQDGTRLRHLPMFPFSGGQGHPSCSAKERLLGTLPWGWQVVAFPLPASQGHQITSYSVAPGLSPHAERGGDRVPRNSVKAVLKGRRKVGRG